MRHWLKKLAHIREVVETNRLMRPVAHWLAAPSLWHVNRRSVARGTAVGLFCSFILPVGQIFLAALISIVTRSNLIVAGAATLVTNPLTMTPIYFLAYRTGHFVLGPTADLREALEDEPVAGSYLQSLSDATLYRASGLLIFATVSAILGYLLVNLVWWASLRLRQRQRRERQRAQRASLGRG